MDEQNKVFDINMDRMHITDMETRIEMKLWRDEEVLLDAINFLLPKENVFLFLQENETAFGHTYPVFEDSYVIPEGHMLFLSCQNFFVLTHELAHIKDFKRNPSDAHDATFIKIWKELIYELAN